MSLHVMYIKRNIIILHATISNKCVKVSLHKSQDDVSGEIWESVTWCWSWCQVRFTTVVSQCKVTPIHSDSVQHLTWPHESLSRNWAQPVANVLPCIIWICVYSIVVVVVALYYSMSLTYILISVFSSIRLPVLYKHFEMCIDYQGLKR